MSARICVTFSDSESVVFPDGLRASEIEQVRDWTKGRIGSRQAFFDAIAGEDNDALKALRLLNLRRHNDVTQRFAEIEVNFDGYDAYFIDDDGREIEPDIVLDDDGDPQMKLLPDGSMRPKVAKNADGTDRWVYTDTRDPVASTPPTRRRKSGGKTTSETTPTTPS